MYVPLSDEQSFLIEAAAGALSRPDTLGAARAVLDGAPHPSLWELAAQSGWTGLLSAEAVGGAGLSAREAGLVLEACGRRLADARLLGHLPAVALLELAGTQMRARADLAAGTRRAALIDAELTERGAALAAREDPGGAPEALLLSGQLEGLLDADGAELLVVVARRGDGAAVAALCEAGAPGVEVTARRGYDATRALADVSFDGARASDLGLDLARVADGASLQRMLLASESVGAAESCLAMAREHALERVAFGRRIGSFQAIKHKLVEMLRRIENARSLVIGAARGWERAAARSAGEDGAFALLANAARVSATDALDYASAENIFIHGGVGATWEHDAQLYYRRAELSRRLAGGADAPAERVALELQTGAASGPRCAPAVDSTPGARLTPGARATTQAAVLAVSNTQNGKA